MLNRTLPILFFIVHLISGLGHAQSVQTPKRISPGQVWLITQNDCEACESEINRLQAPGGVFESMKARGWKIGHAKDDHIQIVNSAKIPSLVEKWEIQEFPTIAYVEGGEIVRSFKDGCSTPLDAYTFGWLMKGVSERPTAEIPTAITVASTSNYQLRGNHWNIEGNWSAPKEYILHHLRGPNHAQLYPDSWPLESWSLEELRSLHDDLHEMNRPRTPLNTSLDSGNSVAQGAYVPLYRPQPAVQSYQSFPNSSRSSKSGSTSRPGKR